MSARRASVAVGMMLIAFAALLALTAIGVWKLGTWFGFFLVYQWIFNQITNYGVDTNLARIAAILIGSAVWVMAIYVWRNNRKWSIAVVLGLLVLQSGFLYFANIGRYFSPQTGEATRYYTVNPITRTIQLFDSPIFDAFGQKAERVTFEIAQRLERQRRSSEFPNDEVPAEKINNFFDPYTGEALVYYCQDSGGNYHLYLRNGFDSKTGVQLASVTQDVVKTILPKTPEEILSDCAFDSAVMIIPVDEEGRTSDNHNAEFYLFGEWSNHRGTVRRVVDPYKATAREPFRLGRLGSSSTGALKFFPSEQGEQWPNLDSLISNPDRGTTILVAVRPKGDIDLYGKDSTGHITSRYLPKPKTSWGRIKDTPDQVDTPPPSPPTPSQPTPTTQHIEKHPLPNPIPATVKDSDKMTLRVGDQYDELYGYEYKRGFAVNKMECILTDDGEGRRHITAIKVWIWNSVAVSICGGFLADDSHDGRVNFTKTLNAQRKLEAQAVTIPCDFDTWSGQSVLVAVAFSPPDNELRLATWDVSPYETTGYCTSIQGVDA